MGGQPHRRMRALSGRADGQADRRTSRRAGGQADKQTRAGSPSGREDGGGRADDGFLKVKLLI